MDYSPILSTYQGEFASSPRLFRSPGRINLIGEHTDYNDGFVLPAAIDREIGMAVGPNGTDEIRLHALDLNARVHTRLSAYQEVTQEWAKYILGVVDQLLKQGHNLGGFDVVFAGDIPQGAGLSSSAALECATAFALDQIFALGLDRTQIAQYAQRAENEFVGVNCGIMDQFASVFGQHQQAICIDCRSLGYSAIPLDLGDYQLVMVDSQVTHNLADSEYNTRRRECEEAVARLQTFYPDVVALRDVTPQQVQDHQADLPELLYRRARYIAEENERVTLATQALKKGDLEALGALLYQSHDGMRYGFEITCLELDFLVEF
ncbi:MAG: galactokinase, partial [Bacteroidota bacterium]